MLLKLIVVLLLTVPVVTEASCLLSHRSTKVLTAFKHSTGYPHGRKGYVIDHIIPLCLGGADAVSNMQWQTVRESYIKDKIERQQCQLAWKH